MVEIKSEENNTVQLPNNIRQVGTPGEKIKIYIVSIIFITLALSMYESCAQTYLVLLFISIFIKLVNEEEKGIFKFFV